MVECVCSRYPWPPGVYIGWAGAIMALCVGYPFTTYSMLTILNFFFAPILRFARTTFCLRNGNDGKERSSTRSITRILACGFKHTRMPNNNGLRIHKSAMHAVHFSAAKKRNHITLSVLPNRVVRLKIEIAGLAAKWGWGEYINSSGARRRFLFTSHHTSPASQRNVSRARKSYLDQWAE